MYNHKNWRFYKTKEVFFNINIHTGKLRTKEKFHIKRGEGGSYDENEK